MTMKIEVLNVRLPSEIIKWLDSLVEIGIYKSRSEAIREFSREYIKSARAGKMKGDVLE
jgi:Arc/MetJ-type ribon-helix-helix transcriptional regulator